MSEQLSKPERASDEQHIDQPTDAEASKTGTRRSRGGITWPVKSLAIGLSGMILGAIVGVVIEEAIASTGLLGPGLDAIIAEQNEGFERLDAKLEELRATTDPDRVKDIATELQSIVSRQQELAIRTEEELRGAREEIERLQQQALEQSGSTVGATLWLKAGEAATIGEGQNAFGVKVVEARYNRVRVNASGKDQFMTVGETVTFPVQGGSMQVIFKLAEPRSDGRVGFDVVRVDENGTAVTE